MVPGIITAVLLVLFVVGTALLWRPGTQPVMDEAARMPLDDDREEIA